MIGPTTLLWFARHEFTLAWRDWKSMMTAGKAQRERVAGVIVAVFVLGLHILAYGVLVGPLSGEIGADKSTLMTLTGAAALAFALMLSQALESITRAFYSRSDLDLILSSPASATRLFTVRIGAIVLSTASLSVLLAAPFVNMAIYLDGWRWFAIYPAVAALAAIATALSLAATVAMFRTIGARHTRLAAQIVAAVVGAGFLIGTQVIGILYYGSYSRLALFNTEAVVASAPNETSMFWLTARAFMGEPTALMALSAFGLAVITAAVVAFAGGFGALVIEAAGISESRWRNIGCKRAFRVPSPRRALRIKEWQLLARDPWLVSQSLMQVLYLIPPAVLLWQKFGGSASAVIILAPVLVMAIGQLAGGLAWLAISGEDAPDLVASAPLPPRAIIRAKIEAVLLIIVVIVGPLVLMMALVNLWAATMTALGVAIASASAVAIQLWFQSESKRSNFRRRQTASKASTFAEAFSSILWAGTAALAAAGSWFAVLFGGAAIFVLMIAKVISPRAAYQ